MTDILMGSLVRKMRITKSGKATLRNAHFVASPEVKA